MGSFGVTMIGLPPLFFSDLATLLTNSPEALDLIVGVATYKSLTGSTPRSSYFSRPLLFNASQYRSRCFLGHIPPHQAALFSPRILSSFSSFDTSFLLSADLDYFLTISTISTLKVLSTDLVFVYVSDTGISSSNNLLRFSEVLRAYSKSFPFSFPLVFLLRYFHRFCSLFRL